MRVSLRSVLAVVVALGAACSRAEPALASAPSASPIAVVPAPASLVADLTVSDPRRLWSALRALGGSRVQTWPSSFELALFLAFGLPARAAGFVKPDTPVVGAVLAPSDRLGSKPWAAALAEGRAPAAFALFSDVSRYAAASARFTGRAMGPQSEATAPVLAVFGKRGNEASLELVLSAPACAALVALAGTP